MSSSEPPVLSSARWSSGRDRAADASDLVERYGDMVYNLSVRLTGDREEARDLAQEAFIRLVKGFASYRGEASLKTWVCQVVVNCHRNRARWWRRLKRGRTVSLDEPAQGVDPEAGVTLADNLADASPLADRVALSREAGGRLQAELAKLPRDQRAALLLREVEGLSYAEIAVALGVREGTVKSRIARAREYLRGTLADLAPARLDGREEVGG